MSSKASPGGGGRRARLVLDPKLLPRVLAYLDASEGENGNQARVQVEDIVDHLRSKYAEYGRKPYNGLLKQVSALCEQQRVRAQKDAAVGGAVGGGNAEADDADRAMEVVEDDDEVEVIEPEDANLINSSMRALYKTPTKPAPPSVDNSTAASATVAPATIILPNTPPFPATTQPAASPAATSAPSDAVPPTSSQSSINPKKRKKYRINPSLSILSATHTSASLLLLVRQLAADLHLTQPLLLRPGRPLPHPPRPARAHPLPPPPPRAVLPPGPVPSLRRAAARAGGMRSANTRNTILQRTAIDVI